MEFTDRPHKVQEKTQKLLRFWTKKKLAKAKLKNKSLKKGRGGERELRKEYLIRAEEAEDFAPSILAQTIPTTKHLRTRGREEERQKARGRQSSCAFRQGICSEF
jgi:hypothetical protein